VKFIKFFDHIQAIFHVEDVTSMTYNKEYGMIVSLRWSSYISDSRWSKY